MTNSPKSAENGSTYARFTVRMAWQLAAPHTWPASIMSTLCAVAFAATSTDTLSLSLCLTLLVISVLMQSSVNTFNDYFDYVKGSDSAQDNVDPTDAVLVYNNVNPRCALALAVGMLGAAFLLGIYAILVAGWIPLAIAAVGAAIVVLYSGGKTPISYLPIGEAVSGIVMGGLIPLACYHVLTLQFEPLVLIWSVPVIIGIGLIMLTNNTCDVEKDIEANRSTLSVKIGRTRARKLYHALVVTWIVAITAIVALWFAHGIVLVPFMLLAAYPFLKALFANPLEAKTRIAAMSQICTVNVVLGAFYAACVLGNSAIALTW